MSDTYLPGDTRQRIQDLIKNRKITQAELAERVGLSSSTLSRYLQGRTANLGDGFIIRIAKYFDVSTDFLLGETDIPERKNYDIEELGLSAETAKLLYTGKVDASVLNQLVEHPRFPQLLLLLARYRDETMIAGINAMNQILTFMRSLTLDQANLHPENAVAAKNAAGFEAARHTSYHCRYKHDPESFHADRTRHKEKCRVGVRITAGRDHRSVKAAARESGQRWRGS